MQIEYNEAKRRRVLTERGLDMARADEVFAAFHLNRRDAAHSDDEHRTISVGALDDQVIIVVWTERPDARRIITMWKANDKERQAYHRQRERFG